VSVLFLFEDIDYYVETTKQVLLYKILDTLQYCSIKFVFVATSMKIDIVDSFEKRIKSRFSHRQVLLYDHKFEIFEENLMSVFDEQLAVVGANPELGSVVGQLRELAKSGAFTDTMISNFDNGK